MKKQSIIYVWGIWQSKLNVDYLQAYTPLRVCGKGYTTIIHYRISHRISNYLSFRLIKKKLL